MKWSETIASKCRYGEIAERIFGDSEVIYECSEDDYQGHANVLARMPDGSFIHYEWTYGSCSGCDEWESRELTTDQIEQEMRNAMAIFADAATLERYLKLEGEFDKAVVPTANSATNGSLPGMFRWVFGTIGDEFIAMRDVYASWKEKNAKKIK